VFLDEVEPGTPNLADREPLAQSSCVDAMRSARQDEQGPSAHREDQAVSDRTHLASEQTRGVLGCRSRLIEGPDLDS
jgi:hypothetical protein